VAGAAPPGPVGVGENRPSIDRGTLALVASPAAAPGAPPTDQQSFERTLALLQAELANAGAHGAVDGASRARYDRLIRDYRDDVLVRVRAGRLTWAQAAREASEIRNQVMTMVRAHTTPIGRAYAEKRKPVGRTLNELIARKTVELHGPAANFTKLSPEQQNRVYAAIVQSAGKSDPYLTPLMRRVSVAGRALLAFSLAISVYNVATADNKAAAAGREVAVTGGGIAGGVAGGALAGLVCGPGAPVCVTIGAFAGGAAAALGVDWFLSSK
jgi:hypothetical protein